MVNKTKNDSGYFWAPSVTFRHCKQETGRRRLWVAHLHPFVHVPYRHIYRVFHKNGAGTEADTNILLFGLQIGAASKAVLVCSTPRIASIHLLMCHTGVRTWYFIKTVVEGKLMLTFCCLGYKLLLD